MAVHQDQRQQKNKTPAFEKPAQPVPARRQDKQQTGKPGEQQKVSKATTGVIGGKDDGVDSRRQCVCPDGSAGQPAGHFRCVCPEDDDCAG